ncbi:PEP-CTERM sorting domain-containing protein [Marinobacter sediminum]|uniref:PEP-CTERM sorting domain-containing protein n=1 Tax=Marinobacter sediminum TaxID=256323 RepID=UPI0019398792|nr:PEP-CTERM sorting domain-containing protein [Marinobacter sediminum]
MKLFKTALGFVFAAVAGAALATPQYHGTTTANGDLALSHGAGYYIWNDLHNTRDWFVRWTAPGVIDSDSTVEWFGHLQFGNSMLGTVEEFGFETSGAHVDTLSSMSFGTSDFITWEAATNDSGGVDGFNFTLTGHTELLQFALGSSIYSGLAPTLADPGVASTGIFIGDGYASTNTLVLEGSHGIYQQFEISVAEPSTLALLGLGLVGFGVLRRRKKE